MSETPFHEPGRHAPAKGGSGFAWWTELGFSHRLHGETRTLAGANFHATRIARHLGTYRDGVVGGRLSLRVTPHSVGRRMASSWFVN